ncbi:hypothetical protein KQX54_018598 [Cotesia glomerata]|uniref:EB domain-containing protein n=1 Tax=Cotesia glomerata TaxID=32391 RepID=A0AAV7IAP4_COTGL|nr:hypothetical protein KQX54_018598 [Cotesia glomerata]
MASKMFLLAFFVVSIFAASVSGENCVKSGKICHDHAECCNPNDKCYVESLANFTSTCRGEGFLGGSCKNNIDCSRITGGTCDNGICACQSGYTESKKNLCNPDVKDPNITYARK